MGAGEGEESNSNAVFRGEAERGRMYSVSEDERGVDAGELKRSRACLSSLPSEPRARQRSTVRETSTGNMSCNRSFAVRGLENRWPTRKVDCEEEDDGDVPGESRTVDEPDEDGWVWKSRGSSRSTTGELRV